MKIKVLAKEITDAEIEAVSLVKRGANRSPFKIVKKEDEAEDPLTRALSQALAPLMDRLNGTPAPQDIAKQKSSEIGRLERKLAILSDQLEAVWGGELAPNCGRERQILNEITKTETDLAAIRGRNGIDFDGPNHSAFAFRGGTSYRGVANLNEPDALGIRKNDALRKAESEIDLSPLSNIKI